MKTITEHNKERSDLFQFMKRMNSGIECPKCQTELHWKDNFILSSYPPKRWVLCPNCKHQEIVAA